MTPPSTKLFSVTALNTWHQKPNALETPPLCGAGKSTNDALGRLFFPGRLSMHHICSLILGLTLVFSTLSQAGLPPQEWQLIMGNPSNATKEATNKSNYLMEKRYYALSYNDQKGIPNWVSWHLSSEYLGDAPRKPSFDSDTDLPHGFHQVSHSDYSGSGFDRGHMCPHGDRTLDQEMSFATFLTTNIVPQTHVNNAGAWEMLEIYSRDLATTDHKDLFIVSGPIGQGGTGLHGAADTVGKGKVVVPNEIFKVILVANRDEKSQPTEWVNENTRLIAVIMPNDQSVDANNWGKYRTTVDAVEKKAGLKFFSAAPKEVVGPKKLKIDTTTIKMLPRPPH